jgi:hypothetical protein
MVKSVITLTVSLFPMPDLDGVSHDVSEAANALANASGRVARRAVLAGCTTARDTEAYIMANDVLVQEALAELSAAVCFDIAAAVETERKRCRMVEHNADVRAARMACAETRAILEPTVWKLADAQDVHRLASDAYRIAFDSLETALELADAGTVD